jgi:hypothetical protein
MRARNSAVAGVTRLVLALFLLSVLTAVASLTGTTQAHAAASPRAATGQAIVAAAASQAGVAYCEGGGGPNGPSPANPPGSFTGCPTGTNGFDCMSLAQYAVFQATGIVLSGSAYQPLGAVTFIQPGDQGALFPGDVVYFGGTLGNFIHDGIYAGVVNGVPSFWDDLSWGNPVALRPMAAEEVMQPFDGGARYWTVGAPTGAGPTSGPTSGPLTGQVVGMAGTPSGGGYWLADAAGLVSAHGSAVNYGSMAGKALNAPIAHIVSTADGNGYWLVASDGGIFTFGDAAFYGSMGDKHLNAPVVDLAPTPDGGGYWLVASDGGIFSFGDAVFHGSMGGQHLNRPVVGIAADPATGGYWEVSTDGGIFSFGAQFFGSTGSIRLNQPINGMTAAPDGQGYWFVASDGGVFAEGSAEFQGSEGGTHLNAPVVGMATDAATGGYWLVASDGGIFTFGAPYDGRG